MAGGRLSGGSIAGIAVGAVLGFAGLATAVLLISLYWRRRRTQQRGLEALKNEPSPAWVSSAMSGGMSLKLVDTGSSRDRDGIETSTTATSVSNPELLSTASLPMDRSLPLDAQLMLPAGAGWGPQPGVLNPVYEPGGPSGLVQQQPGTLLPGMYMHTRPVGTVV